jgi:hypothetical protein
MQREPLITELKQRYGPLLGPSEFAWLLGFKSHDSCMRALRTGALHVPVFRLPGRPGYFAFTEDVADWLLAAKWSASNRPDEPASLLEEVPHRK